MKKVITIFLIAVSIFSINAKLEAKTSSPKLIKEWSYDNEDEGKFKLRKSKSRSERTKSKINKLKSSRKPSITRDSEPPNIDVITLEDSPSKQKKKEPKLSELEKKRLELKQNEKQSLDFIFPSVDEMSEQSKEDVIKGREEFYSETEKDQLLELWRATIVRNRTIQFIVRTLAEDPNDIKKNNAVIQALSKAIYIPFYTLTTVSDSTLVNSGSAVGARVLGDVINSVNKKRSQTQQVTKTEMIVLFMLVDEVAQRLRATYFDYKRLRTEKALLKQELEDSQNDAVQALHGNSGSAKFLTRMIVRNNESRLRQLDVSYRASKKELMELSGAEAVLTVDKMIDLEIESTINEPIL